jgi:Na+/H+-dicarboxylate symporter
LPTLLESAVRTLGRSPEDCGLLLPLAVAIFRFSSPFFLLIAMCFAAELYALPFGVERALGLMPMAILLSLGIPSVPGGTFSASAALFAAAGLPLEAIGLLLAMDAIPDALRTTVNVTMNMALSALFCGRADEDAACTPVD